MRRLGRSILNGLTVLSLLLCAAAMVLWARNAWHGPPWDEVYRVRATCSYGVGMEAGRVIAFLQRQGPAYREGDARDVYFSRAGVRYVRATGDGVRRWNWVVPAWLVAAASMVLPLSRLVSPLRRRHRRRSGLCVACAYDLRGNVSGVCPECGTVVAGVPVP